MKTFGGYALSEKVIEEPDHFRRAQERALEERLKRALENEIAAHRALAVHYGRCLEQLADAEVAEKHAKDGVVRIKKIVGRLKNTVRLLIAAFAGLVLVVGALLYFGVLQFVA